MDTGDPLEMLNRLWTIGILASALTTVVTATHLSRTQRAVRALILVAIVVLSRQLERVFTEHIATPLLRWLFRGRLEEEAEMRRNIEREEAEMRRAMAQLRRPNATRP